MKEINLLKAMLLVKRADRMKREDRERLQRERLEELVNYARENSPYLSEKYKDAGSGFRLSDVPPSNKVELLAHFDEWVTDREVSLEKVREFMKDTDNVGRKFLGKYLVYTTSGSTGNPCIVLYDMTANNVAAALGVSRSFARKEDMKAFIKGGGRSMGLYADKGFYLGCGSIHYNIRKMPWKKRQLRAYDVRNKQEDIVRELNRFQPTMLGSYPTSLELLMPEQKAGRLHISPVLIMTGGEYLNEDVRRELSETFGCYVQTTYSSTEGGTMTCECTEKHFHINDDWIIIEAVDENNQPVPFGTQSAKILLTNLSNHVQPIIRFEITDRVIMHKEACPCGKDSPWLLVEGRTDEILTFREGKRVAPLSLYALLKEVHGITRFQLVQKTEELLELRIVAENREAAFLEAENVLLRYLSEMGIHAQITLSDKEPETNPYSGKFKHIIAMPAKKEK